jgi:protein O-mannosyl-transferase
MNSSVPIRREKTTPFVATPGERQWLSRPTFVIAAACLVVAVFAIYWPTLEYQFILDDHRFTSDPRIQFSGHIWDYFTNYVWAEFTGGPPSFYRPVFVLWMRVNFIFNALSPSGWHFFSMAKHVAVALLLGWLVLRLLHDRTAALLAATLFALHPAQTESVAWTTVPDPLMAAGILSALLLYFRYLESSLPDDEAQAKKVRKTSRKKNDQGSPGLWLAASAVACFLAQLAKETATVFPAVIFALALVRPGRESLAGRATLGKASFGVRVGQALRQAAPFVAVTMLYLLLRLNALQGKLSANTQELSWNTVVLSWPATLWFYVKVIFWPARSYAFSDPTLVDRFAVRSVLLPFVGVVCLAALWILILVWAWRKARRTLVERRAAEAEYALIAGSLLIALPLVLTLNLNALNPGDFLHGRYTYLPLAALMLLAATGWHLAGKLRFALLGVAGLVAVCFAGLTVSEEKQWKDDLTVFTMAHELAPHNAPVAKNLADAQVQAALQLDDCSQSMPVFEQVGREYPQDWFAWAALGSCLVQSNDLKRAEEALHRAADLSQNPKVIQEWQQLRASMGLASTNPLP